MPRRWFVAALVLFLLPTSMQVISARAAEPANSPRLKLSTERVVIFKDGHGLVVKSGVATADADGRAYTADVPDGAVLGCFWAIGQDKKVLGMRAEWDERKEVRNKETPAVTVAELLRANLGKAVSLELTDKTDKGTPLTREGQVSEMLELPPDLAPKTAAAHQPDEPASIAGPIVYTTLIRDGVAASGSFTPETIAAGGTLVRELVPRGSEYVVISQEGGRRVILPISHVESVSGGKDFATTVTRGEEILTRSKRLSFDFGKDAAGKQVSLKLFYFTAGLRWIPTYRVSGELKDKAELALQGEVLNDVTDIDHAALDLVVGVPNFRFKDTVSPLTLEQTLRRVALETLTIGNNSYNGQMLNANFDNNRLVAVPAVAGGEAPVPELANAAGEQDLFVYGLKDFSLKKGARATVPLWEQSSNLRHLYTYDIRARRSRISGGLLDETAAASGAQSPLQISINQVWHQLELSNTGTVPWTTGAALMLRESLPIGQDLLTYTPPTSKALLPVTVAVDLRGTHDDQELDRKPNALHFDGQEYMQVRKKGTVTVTSYRKEKSDMRITVATGGKVTAASDDGKTKVNDFRAADWDEPAYMRVNNHSDVVWEFTIDPGTTKTITYEATFFVR